MGDPSMGAICIITKPQWLYSKILSKAPLMDSLTHRKENLKYQKFSSHSMHRPYFTGCWMDCLLCYWDLCNYSSANNSAIIQLVLFYERVFFLGISKLLYLCDNKLLIIFNQLNSDMRNVVCI
jgi:hypothetical protein